MSTVTTLFARNVGTADRVIRMTVGIILLSLVVVGPRTAWGLLGVVPLLTSALGTCPFYTLFGLNTCGVRGR